MAAPVKKIILLGKTKFQTDKAAREQKLKKQQDDAAAVYESFVESFQDERNIPKTFVRGGVIQRGEDPSASAASIPAAGTEYRLEPRRHHVPEAQPANDAALAPGGSSGGAKKTRELDLLLQELKTNPGQTAGSLGVDSGRGGRGGGGPLPSYIGDSDQGTTNVYVGNLAPTVTEEALSALFGRHGAVLSVKVMW